MKKAIILFLALAILPFFGQAQALDNLDYVSPSHNGLTAIKKDGKWAFINNEGNRVVNYRNDLVLTESKDGTYPLFNNDRCLIVQKKEDISYFGYIDTKGNEVIEPRFLNAKNFNNGKAIALELIKENVTKNVALDKNIVYYKYVEVVIDINGEVENYLNPSGINIVLDRDFLRKPPKITAKRISDNLVAIKSKKGKWAVIKLN